MMVQGPALTALAMEKRLMSRYCTSHASSMSAAANPVHTRLCRSTAARRSTDDSVTACVTHPFSMMKRQTAEAAAPPGAEPDPSHRKSRKDKMASSTADPKKMIIDPGIPSFFLSARKTGSLLDCPWPGPGLPECADGCCVSWAPFGSNCETRYHGSGEATPRAEVSFAFSSRITSIRSGGSDISEGDITGGSAVSCPLSRGRSGVGTSIFGGVTREHRVDSREAGPRPILKSWKDPRSYCSAEGCASIACRSRGPKERPDPPSRLQIAIGGKVYSWLRRNQHTGCIDWRLSFFSNAYQQEMP